MYSAANGHIGIDVIKWNYTHTLKFDKNYILFFCLQLFFGFVLWSVEKLPLLKSFTVSAFKMKLYFAIDMFSKMKFVFSCFKQNLFYLAFTRLTKIMELHFHSWMQLLKLFWIVSFWNKVFTYANLHTQWVTIRLQYDEVHVNEGVMWFYNWHLTKCRNIWMPKMKYLNAVH